MTPSREKASARLRDQFDKNHAARADEHERLQRAVLVRGLAVLLVAAVLFAASLVVPPTLKPYLATAGITVDMVGVLAASTSDYDLDALFSRRRWVPDLWAGVNLATSAATVLSAEMRRDAPFAWMTAPPFIYYFARRADVLRNVGVAPKFTTILAAWAYAISLSAALGDATVLAHQGAWALLAAATAWHTGALSIGGALLAARRSLGATEFAFKSFYLVMLSVCFSFGRTALAHPPGSVDRIAGYVQVVVYIVPLSFVWPNRAKVFGLLARLFASRRRLRDGAFLASMLEEAPPAIGDRWWVPSRDEAAPGGIAWARGRVVQAAETSFVVALDDSAAAPKAEHTIRWRQWAGVDEMLRQANEELRCVPFSRLPADAFATSSAADAAATPIAVKCGAHEIDWFVSHSWHDDGSQKYAALSRAAAAFKAAHGREPRLWIDKYCVDQSRISDVLRLLPVFVSACDAMVVLAGATYASRLWCIWELHTLFTLSDAPRIAILDAGGGDARADLSSFEVANARCFDPNEEQKIRRAIGATPGGLAEFERTVRLVAAEITPAAGDGAAGGGADQAAAPPPVLVGRKSQLNQELPHSMLRGESSLRRLVKRLSRGDSVGAALAPPPPSPTPAAAGGRPPLMVHTSSSDLGDLLSGRSEGGDAAAAQWDAFVGGVSGRSEG